MPDVVQIAHGTRFSTARFTFALHQAEEKPDLAVLSGDMLTGLNVDANATAYWDRLVSVFDKRAVPHSAILGNHDAEPFSGSGKNQSSPSSPFAFS